MKETCRILEKNKDEIFDYFAETLKDTITKWDYFVNWEKVLTNIKPIERELNLLNSLVGKENLEEEIVELILQYPSVIKAIPKLLAIRDRSIDVLIDASRFIYKNFNFTVNQPTKKQAEDFASFLIKSGIGYLIEKRNIKNLVDYVTGVEVGLDSNARKNRTGTLMESIVEVFIADACSINNAEYISQATASKIQKKWNIKIKVDKSSRQLDFAIRTNNNLYFVETNFYGGGGSKLKSTAGEYITMNKFWNSQGITFIWITDGYGWKSTLRPLREYFDKADYLLNLQMLQDNCLYRILK